MTAVDELSAAADADRAETSRKRLQAENYRVGAERIQAALSQQLEQLAIERAEVDRQRAEQLDAILATAEAHRAEALALHEEARGGTRAILAAASLRTELLESMLADRIGEVASTLSTLQGVALERATPNEHDRATLHEFLSTTFREIREYRDAELTAADDRAEALVERAQQIAHEIVAETRREREQLLAGTDARSVLDVVGVLLAESRPAATPDPTITQSSQSVDRPIDVTEGPATTTDAAEASEGSDRADDTVAALSEALEVVDDPGHITDNELADVLRTADRLLGDHATIDDAFDLARALSDALQPNGTEATEAHEVDDDSETSPPPGDSNTDTAAVTST